MLNVIIVIIVLLALLCFFECRRELKFFRVTQYYLCVPKLCGLESEKKIILLADLHSREYGKKNVKLLEAIRLEQPDMILVAGDMLVAKAPPFFQEALDFLEKLPELCPVYYSLGNHEQRLKDYPDKYGENLYGVYRDKLLAAGVYFLENEHAEIQLDNLSVQVTGLELPMETYKKFKKHSVTVEDVTQCVGRADGNKFQMLLAHNPAFFSAYKNWGADLTVSGHLHGGIIRIPGLGGIITPQVNLFPKYSGELTVEEDKAIAVSKGLGTHTINLRFCNYAEVVVINLQPYKGK